MVVVGRVTNATLGRAFVAYATVNAVALVVARSLGVLPCYYVCLSFVVVWPVYASAAAVYWRLCTPSLDWWAVLGFVQGMLLLALVNTAAGVALGWAVTASC